MGNYTRLYQIQDDVLAGVAVLAAKGPYSRVFLSCESFSGNLVRFLLSCY